MKHLLCCLCVILNLEKDICITSTLWPKSESEHEIKIFLLLKSFITILFLFIYSTRNQYKNLS